MTSTETLRALWFGDDDTAGYWHPELVVEMCRQTQPQSADQIVVWLYPRTVIADVDPDAKQIIGEGFRLWQLRTRTLARV